MILTLISVANPGKFILYANIPYLYPNPPLQQAWGTVGNRVFFLGGGGEAYVCDIWPLKNLGEFP